MTKPPKIYISMPTYDLMHVSTCLSLVKLFNKFTIAKMPAEIGTFKCCLLYTSPSPRDAHESRMPSSA